MSVSETAHRLMPRLPQGVAVWWPVIAGLCALYLPTYLRLISGPWTKEEYAHGPIVLAMIVWIVWESRNALANAERRPVPLAGWGLLLVGLLAYVIGRSQGVIFLEVGSQIPVLAAAALLVGGWAWLRILAFALFYIVFLLPLPGFFVDALTGPLKAKISVLAEQLLYFVGYPIARSGVVLTIGQYQLLVADACSGLHSIFSLAALGGFYMYLMKYAGFWRNAILAAAIVPVAFAANVVRVIVLVLVTYHFGDEAGQGFVHDFAGILLFIAGLGIFILFDYLLGFFFKTRRAV